MHTADRRCAGTPGLPCAVVLRLMPRSPRRRIPFASVADGLAIYRARSGSTISISLTPATGARTTRFCRPQLPRAIRLDRPACCRKKFRPRRLSAVRLRAVRSLTDNRPATTRASDAAASTATRTPRIVTPRTSLFMRRDDANKTSISEKGKRYIFFTQSGRPKSR